MKLLNNFYQVACSNLSHFFDATSYLIDTGEGLLLIDCGTPDGYDRIVENIHKTGNDPRNIKWIFGTHGHYDHVGAAKRFKDDYGCKLYLHEEDRVQVETGDDIKTTAGLLYRSHFESCTVDEPLIDDQKFDFKNCHIHVMHTPGHTMGGVCFVVIIDGLKILVAGDTIWGGYSDKIGSDEIAWRESLDRICAEHFDLVTFGHTAPALFGDADTRLREARDSFANYYNPWFKVLADKYRY